MSEEIKHFYDPVSKQDIWTCLERFPHLMGKRSFEACTSIALHEHHKANWVAFDYLEGNEYCQVMWGNGAGLFDKSTASYDGGSPPKGGE
jgi:hypothetical protein